MVFVFLQLIYEFIGEKHSHLPTPPPQIRTIIEWTVDETINWMKNKHFSENACKIFRKEHIDGIFFKEDSSS